MAIEETRLVERVQKKCEYDLDMWRLVVKEVLYQFHVAHVSKAAWGRRC